MCLLCTLVCISLDQLGQATAFSDLISWNFPWLLDIVTYCLQPCAMASASKEILVQVRQKLRAFNTLVSHRSVNGQRLKRPEFKSRHALFSHWTLWRSLWNECHLMEWINWMSLVIIWLLRGLSQKLLTQSKKEIKVFSISNLNLGNPGLS